MWGVRELIDVLQAQQAAVSHVQLDNTHRRLCIESAFYTVHQSVRPSVCLSVCRDPVFSLKTAKRNRRYEIPRGWPLTEALSAGKVDKLDYLLWSIRRVNSTRTAW